MGTIALRVSAAPSAPMPQGAPRKTFLSIGKNALEMILSLVDDVRASSTCRDFRRATEELIKRQWSRFNIGSTPNFEAILSPRHFPETGADLHKLYNGIYQECSALGNAQLAVHAKNAIDRSFKPASFQRLEAAARQAENDWNLMLVWPRIARMLNIRRYPMPGGLTVGLIRESLRKNKHILDTINILDLYGLGLTKIPDEIASLDLPRLEELSLGGNRLTALPANFGASWNRLRCLNLTKNRLTALPDNFGANWNQLEWLLINQNQLKSLPDNFGANWNQLQWLLINQNQLKSLPDNFGANWNQLQRLSLESNKLTVLPDDFGIHWRWWSQKRNTVLYENPILNPSAPTPTVMRSTPTSPPPQPQLQKALISVSAVHILSTVALAAVATYAIGWKIPATIGALYLGHRYMRGDLWAL